MFGIFKKNKPRTALEEFESNMVKMFRPLLVNNKNLSDEKILEIVETVTRAFAQAAESKGERISGEILMNIAAKFVKVYDLSGADFFMEHLKYEINLYITSGLRDDYTR